MPLINPPSRLSPPPGTKLSSLLTSATEFTDGFGGAGDGDMDSDDGGGRDDGDELRRDRDGSGPRRNDAPKRGYRACVHCRLRKAKCDLGDVNAPSEPPCTRCRREQRNCVFLPSKRRRKTATDDNTGDVPTETMPKAAHSASAPVVPSVASTQPPRNNHITHPPPLTTPVSQDRPRNTSTHGQDWTSLALQPATHTFQNWPDSISTSIFRDTAPQFSYPDLSQPLQQQQQQQQQQHRHQAQPQYRQPHQQQRQSLDLKSSMPPHPYPSVPPPGPSSTLDFRSFPEFSTSTGTGSDATLGLNHATPASADSGSTSALSPVTRAKKRQASNPDATRRIVVANFSNETDALEILADAATDGDDKDRPGGEEEARTKKVQFKDEQASLSDFILIQQGIITEEAVLWALVHLYFEHHHPVLPIIQTPRIPRTPQALATFAHEDPFLVSCLVIIASAHHSDPAIRTIHERVWAMVRETLADYTFGGVEASMGLVEGVLLLAEFLPREAKRSPPLLNGKTEGGLHGTDNRRTWTLTGLAIRAAYGLQLDQAALEMEPRSFAQERARLVWTWCYLYDRTIGLRTGLAFWSRGPSICFTGYSHISQTGEVAAKVNFPSMLSPTPAEFYDSANPKPGAQLGNGAAEGAGLGGGEGLDSASLIQALMELTQIMTNAHDTLYPNKVRTDDLVKQGGYFRFLDSFRRALESFKEVWQVRKWQSESLKELTWCTYEMVRLYVSSFAFQAHVQRAWARAEGTTTSVQLFPRGSATSPDALYIYASVDAANEILSICLRLSKLGVLGYLPSRYLINFVFGGVFALKAGYSGAVGRTESAKTRGLVDRVCAALVLASPDRDHPTSRYGQMLRLLSKKLEQLSDQSAVPSRFPSPEPESEIIPTQDSTSMQDLLANPAFRHLAGSSTSLMSTDVPNLMASGLVHTGLTPPQNGLEGLFDFDVDVNFNLDGFWDDFTLAEGGGFPFR